MQTVDLVDADFWAQPYAERDKAFAALRATGEPVFCPRADGAGFYALTHYDEVYQVSRNPEAFSSEPSAASLDDLPPESQRFLGSMLSVDNPRHARLRRIVARAFTPRMIAKAADDVARLATEIVDSIVERGPSDFVAEVAMPMPLEIVCSMMGVPESVRPEVVETTNLAMELLGDPDYVSSDGRDRGAVLFEVFSFLHELMAELAQDRRERPAEDMITALVNADVDGEALDDGDLGRFFTLLVTAGNETTRTALSHALMLFTEHAQQRDRLLGDVDKSLPAAVEEVIRYATPVNWMRRTVRREVELGKHTYRAGDRVVMYYVSANKDESVFADPFSFDITRDPNPHVGFGAPGPHHCLGAHLARRETTLMLRELFTRLPDIHATAEPVRQRGSFANGIKALPYAF